MSGVWSLVIWYLPREGLRHLFEPAYRTGRPEMDCALIGECRKPGPQGHARIAIERF
jgi:hypothetical protein